MVFVTDEKIEYRISNKEPQNFEVDPSTFRIRYSAVQ
jgi:hypothetical protein